MSDHGEPVELPQDPASAEESSDPSFIEQSGLKNSGLKQSGLTNSALRKWGNRFAIFSAFVFVTSFLWVGIYRYVTPPATFTMLERKRSGDVIVNPKVSIHDISPHLVRAVIAAEDMKFCRHIGFDFGEVRAAIKDAQKGKGLRGASTISQQTAKNAFLFNGGGFVRKGVEVWFTGFIEVMWPKRRIIEVYLNIAEWGDGLFGAEAAAQARFNKAASQLTKQEAALLAAVLPSPNKWRVDPPGPYVRQRARTIRARMDRVQKNDLDQCIY